MAAALAEACSVARTCGRIAAAPGPPTPRTGPASPAGTCPGWGAGTPRPAALPLPGPACVGALSERVGEGQRESNPKQRERARTHAPAPRRACRAGHPSAAAPPL